MTYPVISVDVGRDHGPNVILDGIEKASRNVGCAVSALQ